MKLCDSTLRGIHLDISGIKGFELTGRRTSGGSARPMRDGVRQNGGCLYVSTIYMGCHSRQTTTTLPSTLHFLFHELYITLLKTTEESVHPLKRDQVSPGHDTDMPSRGWSGFPGMILVLVSSSRLIDLS